jgi:selenocysteine-specific elongation factor
VALNLGGIKAIEIERGDVIVPPQYLSASYMIDAKLYLLSDAPRPLRNRARVRLHHGTQELLGRVILLEEEELAPGKSAYVQFRLETPIVPKFKDKFIIRSYSPIFTIGGGEILNGHPSKHKRHRSDIVEAMNIREHGSVADLVELILDEEKRPFTVSEIVSRSELLKKDVIAALDNLVKEAKIETLISDEKLYFNKQTLAGFQSEILEFLKDYAEQNPLARGAKKELVRTKILSSLSPKVADIIFGRLSESGLLVQEGDIIRIRSKEAGLSDEQKRLTSQLMQLLEKNPFGPPTLKEIMAELKLKQDQLQQLLKILLDEGKVERVRFDLYFSSVAVEEAKSKIMAFLEANERITAAEFRDLVGTSRKFAVPILEYLDLKRITKRIGDYRVLAK